MNKRVGANKRKKKKEVFAKLNVRGAARRIFPVVTYAVLAIIVCGAGFFAAKKVWNWMGTSATFTVRTIALKGCKKIDTVEIRRLSGLSIGMRMIDVKPAVSEKAIAVNCWVRKVSVTRRIPNAIVITVEERIPIALVNAGKVYYLDREGVLMPLFTGTYTDLPVLSGTLSNAQAVAGMKIPQQTFKRIQGFFDQADKINAALIKHLSQIDFSERSQIKLKIENSPMVIELDDGQEAAALTRLKSLMDVFENSSEGMPRRINLCYDNLAYAQW